MEGGIGEGKAYGAIADGIVSKDRHRGDRQHLQKREYTGPDIVVSVQIMIQGAVEPCPPDNDKEEDKGANPRPSYISGKRVGKLSDDHHIDQIIEKL